VTAPVFHLEFRDTGIGARFADNFLTRLFAGLTAIGTIRLTLLSLLHERDASVAANLHGADGTQPG
jgi:hypothetical protein